eukprot:COSAG01_NODE_6639_length_3567_cov_37.767013_6_plen_109_part_00
MHCAFCTRNVWRCAQCDEVMARSEREAHEQEVHAEVACECGEVMQKRALKRHKAEACMLKQVACESFSDDVSPAAACLGHTCHLQLALSSFHWPHWRGDTSSCSRCAI